MIFFLVQVTCGLKITCPKIFARSNSTNRWKQSFKAGLIDKTTGKPIRGTEIVHLAAHKGHLYAGNGYWMDTRGRNRIPWAQVLVLDSPDAAWKVDLSLGKGYLRVTALKSVVFTTDGNGKKLSKPVNLLLAASDIMGRYRQSDIWTRDDDRNTWVKTTLQAGTTYRRSTRALFVHRDKQTHADRIFVAAGALGIYSGVYDCSQPGKIRWDRKAELGPLEIRPMSFAEANNILYVSSGTSIYCRFDGPVPSWKKVYSDNTRKHWELGGIRGLTAVRSPDGSGESILFSHTDRIIRLDPSNHNRATIELNIRELAEKKLGIAVKRNIIAAYSNMLRVKDPVTKKEVLIMGVQCQLVRRSKNKNNGSIQETFHGYYPGALYLVRKLGRQYRFGEINGHWKPGNPMLLAARTFTISPFPGDAGKYIYFGGFDANFFPALDTAWIFRASVENVLQADK